jgi:stalled ribosome rescue protein Dom34
LPGTAKKSPHHEKEIRYLADAAKVTGMSVKNKKQFGVWMDSRYATIIGYADPTAEKFSVLGHAKNPGVDGNTNENAAHNQEKTLQNQFFKEITTFMQNAEEVHVTGTGTAQEQFIHYLAETPQFKNTVATECTTTKMSEEALIEHIASKFN